MKKLILGLCLAFSLCNGDCYCMKKTSIHSATKRSERSHRVILPEMTSGKLYFKEIPYPDVLDKYRGSQIVKIIQERFQKIANLGLTNPQRIFELANEVIKDDSEQEWLMDEVGCANAQRINDTVSLVYVRLLELGVINASFVVSEFYSQNKENVRRHLSSMEYNGRPITEQTLCMAGLHIKALASIKTGLPEEVPDFFEEYCSVEQLAQEELPSTNYISWAIERGAIHLKARR